MIHNPEEVKIWLFSADVNPSMYSSAWIRKAAVF